MSNHILQLAAYKQPEVVESNQKEWVEYGSDNNYFQYLIDRYNASTTNSAVIGNICKLIFGRGLTAVNANQKPNEYAQALSLFSPEDLKKIITDRKMLGQCALQLHYDKGHKKVLKAYHIPVHLLRAEKCNKDGEIEAHIRIQFSNMNISGIGPLQGSELIADARTEKENLTTELKEMLNEVSRKGQLERKSQEAEWTQNVMRDIPLTIYIM